MTSRRRTPPHPARLRWWQLRPTEFALLLYALIIQRVLGLGLFAAASVILDSRGVSLDDPTSPPLGYYGIDQALGWDIAAYFGALGLLIWAALAAAALSAWLERAYGRWKFAAVFVGIGTLHWLAMRNVSTVLAGLG